MKKKIVVMSLVVALVAIAVVGGSLAWFTDTDSATNVFTIGSVNIVQNEDFDPDTAQLLPVLGSDPTVSTDNYIQKAVTVENVGKNTAYVQTCVAIPAVLDNNSILKLYDGDLAAKGWVKVDGDTARDGIQPIATGITITGETIPYNVYCYRHTAALSPNNKTAACLEYVYIDSSIDLNTYDLQRGDGVTDTAYFVLANSSEVTGFNATGNLNVYVATQGVQADGFTDADAALSAAFPNHPWATN